MTSGSTASCVLFGAMQRSVAHQQGSRETIIAE
jgi:hypothetical protein